MTETEIIETLKPKCNGYDLPLSLNVVYIAKLLIEKQNKALNIPYVNNSVCPDCKGTGYIDHPELGHRVSEICHCYK